MSNDDVLEKIKKCMALSSSANQNEAAQALKQAQVLMKKHGISEEDIEISAVKCTIKEVQKPPAYIQDLVSIVNSMFGCRVLLFLDITRNYLVFYGLSPDAEIAEYFYAVFRRQIDRDRKEYITALNKRFKRKKKTALANIFCECWVSALREKVQDKFIEVPAVVSKYYDRKDKKIMKQPGRTKVDDTQASVVDAILSGYNKGKDANVNKALQKSNVNLIEFKS